MSAITTGESGTQVTITWVEPANNGAAITSYSISLLKKDTNAYAEYTNLCNGAASAIITAKSCSIEMRVFLNVLGYSIGDTIMAKA